MVQGLEIVKKNETFGGRLFQIFPEVEIKEIIYNYLQRNATLNLTDIFEGNENANLNRD